LGQFAQGRFFWGEKTKSEGVVQVRIFLKSTFLTIALLFCLATPAYALDVTLQWDANIETDLAGYKVYYKTGSSGGSILTNYNGTGAYEGNSPIDMPLALDENPDLNIVEFTVTDLPDGQTYYFVVTAYNDDIPPLESGPSNEEYTTATPLDTTPPYVTNRSPASGATGVAVNTLVALELRDAGVGVNQSTITMRVDGSQVTPSFTGTPAAYTLSYNPPVDFAYDQTVSVEVHASDLNGNAMTTDAYSFTTGPAPDTTPPVISNVQATSITDNSAVITWTTNEASDSAVQYGTTSGSYPLSRNSTTLVTSHSVTLTGLNDDTTYFFRVRSTDGSGNGPTVSNELSFKTDPAPDTTAPTISNVQVTSITQTSAIISWTTNEPSNSEVQYDSARRPWGSYSWGENDNSLVTSHSITLTGLEADTTYYFRVGSTDGSGNGPTTSNQMSFTTAAIPVPPSSPARLKIIRTQ
jgi:hypothetical protein